MSSCMVIPGLVLVALAFIASAVSLVAPYWYHSINGENNGLWATCVNENKCQWFYENDFSWEKDRELWWQVSQGFFAGGVIFLLLTFLIACINLCSSCCDCARAMLNCIKGLLLFSFLFLATGLGVWGYYAYDEMGVTFDRKSHYYDWGYFVGCGGAFLNFIAILIYALCDCCSKDGHDGYTRGEVV